MKPKVLVVDDEESIRDILSIFLSQAGFEVITASDACEFRHRVFDMNPDAIILDLVLEGDNGNDIYNELLAEGSLNRSVPVIYLTALAKDVSPDRPHPGRQYMLMSKPFSCDDLLHDLEILIHK